MSKPNFACTVATLSFYGSTIQQVLEKLTNWDGWEEMEENIYKTVNISLYQVGDGDFIAQFSLPGLAEELPVNTDFFGL